MSRNRALVSLRTIVVCALALLCPTLAWASGQWAPLPRALQSLREAEGPEAYTAIREIWATWGVTNPWDVEQALVAASENPKLPAATRAYAGFFAAHARTRRGDLAGAKARVAQLGYIQDWLVVGPFDNEGKGGLDVDFGPEAEGAEALIPGRAFTGKERPVRWRPLPAGAFPYGWVEGGSLFRPQESICFYATTFFELPGNGPQTASVWMGAGGASKLFVNGQLVLTESAYRSHDVDRYGVQVTLPAGVNRVLIKVCGADTTPAFSVRLADKTGAPLAKPARVSSAFAESAQAATNFGKVQVLDAGIGPVAQFDKRLKRPKPSARTLQAYAEYLVISDGDDPALHWARDYAHRAAELEPSIPRLLLAGDLAEDDNQERAWLERAEALVREQGTPSLEALIARARLERGGLNWRDAYPFFQEALALDPSSFEAVSGVVDLFNEAGLNQTALATLTQAVRVEPNAVNLLNLLATQQRGLGLEYSAIETETRYAQFRFDDSTYLAQRIDTALAQGDRATAGYWLERLLALNPGSIWAHSIAAAAYRRQAEPERAIGALKHALDLAPEDVSLLRSLSDLRGELGDRDEQLRLLRQILALKPQAKDVAEYVEHIEPEHPKQDEAYAWAPERFLKARGKPADGENRRTLLDLSVTTVFDNGLSGQFKQIVFQPLTDSAAALSRNYYFGFQADTQQVQLRGARVYRTDGRIDEAVETGVGAADDPSVAMYTSAQTYYVQFPRLEPGDVVELRYRIDDVTPRNEFADYFGDVQYFQKSEPVGHAEYVLITPIRRKLYIDYHGIAGLKTSQVEKGTQRIYQFSADNLAPVVPEPAMPPWPESLGFIHVSTFQDYKALGKWFWGLAKDQFDLDEETRRLAHSIADKHPTPREKVNAVYHWVIKNTRYVALEFGIYGIKPRRCVQTVARGWGDCKDKATVIVSLLRELGIDSTIVIVRTQMRGAFHSKVASLAPFDHAIAYVPSMNLFLDGTAEFTGSNELPEMDQGALGILVNQGDAQLVTLPTASSGQDQRSKRSVITLDPSGRADVRIQMITQGTEAPEWRRRYQAKGTQRDRVVSDVSPGLPGFELLPGIAGLQVDGDDFEKPVELNVAGHVANLGRREGGSISIAATTRVRLVDSYAPASARDLDVRIGAFGTVQDTYELTLPAGYRVISAPEAKDVTSRFGKYSVSLKQVDNRVQVFSSIALSVSRVAARDYAEWRAFCQAVDAAMSARLVVGK